MQDYLHVFIYLLYIDTLVSSLIEVRLEIIVIVFGPKSTVHDSIL